MTTPQEMDKQARPFVVLVLLALFVMTMATLFCIHKYYKVPKKDQSQASGRVEIRASAPVTTPSLNTNEVKTLNFTIRPRLGNGTNQ